MWYDKLNNKRLWKIFSDISSIPRESGNEEGIRQYLLSWAKEHNIEAFSDRIGNVIMKVKASEGYEDYPSIAIQGHMDMVCVKKDDSDHDFTKDPIFVMTDGKNVWAKDTSLGADNGIAIALALDIFSDENAKHGPLEGIFTVNEANTKKLFLNSKKRHLIIMLSLKHTSEYVLNLVEACPRTM